MTSVAANFFASMTMPATAAAGDTAAAGAADAGLFGQALQLVPTLATSVGEMTVPLAVMPPTPVTTPIVPMPSALLATIDVAQPAVPTPIATPKTPEIAPEPLAAAPMPEIILVDPATPEPAATVAATAPPVMPVDAASILAPTTVTDEPSPPTPTEPAPPPQTTTKKTDQPVAMEATAPEPTAPEPAKAPLLLATPAEIVTLVADAPAEPATPALDSKPARPNRASRAADQPVEDAAPDATALPLPVATAPIILPTPTQQPDRAVTEQAPADTAIAPASTTATPTVTVESTATPAVEPRHQGGSEHHQQGHHAPHHAVADTAPSFAASTGDQPAAFALPGAQIATPAPAAATVATPTATPIVAAVPGRIGQEMGVAIARHVAATTGEDIITVRLDPRDMGRIEVKLSFEDDGTLRAVVAADNPAALDMLRRDSADLGRALSDAGVRSDAQTLRFDSGASGDNGNRANDAWQQRQQAARARNAGTDYPTGSEEKIAAAYQPLRTRGRVDLMA